MLQVHTPKKKLHDCTEIHAVLDIQSRNCLLLYVIDCSGSTYSVILPQLYVKDLLGSILRQTANAVGAILTRQDANQVQQLSLWRAGFGCYQTKQVSRKT